MFGLTKSQQRARKKSSGQIAPLGHASAESSFCNDGNDMAAMSGRVNYSSNGQKRNPRNTSSSSRRNKAFKVSLEAESKVSYQRRKREGGRRREREGEAYILFFLLCVFM
jgi:hypothetical protein